MTNHVWIQENLDAFLADGLTAEERDRFEKHIAGCAACARSLATARNMERAIGELFADAPPDQGLEERMINQLRKPTPHRAAGPHWLRFVGGVAAALLFGGVGAAMFFVFGADGLAGATGRQREKKDGQLTQSLNHLRQLSDRFFDGGKQQEKVLVLDLTDSMSLTEEAPPAIPLPPATWGLLTRTDGEGRELKHLEAAARFGLDGKELVDPSNLSFDVRGFKDIDGSIAGVEKTEKEGKDLKFTSRESDLFADTFVPKPFANRAENGKNGEGDQAPDGTQRGKMADELQQGFSSFGNGHLRRGDQASKNDYFRKAGEEGMPMKMPSFAKTEPPPGTNSSNLPALPATPPLRMVDDPLTGLGANTGVVGGGQKKPEPVPQPAERKIIRTGELEFEIETYDAAANMIAKLADGLQGAYIESDDSTRQANNKKRGVVVVRVPPASMSKFIADLRAELGKMGELKSQRLGSQDVSKQYLDTEGNLRVAKAMEQRFLDIIKSGKGEIKDLIAAENALGEWRTKIERMVGEMRYYDKQVALGTLTITLYEKQIQAPSSLVVTEKVGMRIEVEEVEKAHQAALAAVAEVQGRVTKSELKQFAQGHVKAFINAEVAPASAGALGDRLKKLGIVTHHDVQRLQETKGGTGRSPELKPSVNDVVFEIELYNAANIQPREAIKMQIATRDVPGNYRKLQEAVAKVKGQVRDGKLNEIDKLKIIAHFDFDILASDKPAIDKVISEVGPLFSRSTEQAPVNELATDRRIGYRLILRNVAGIPWREKNTLTIEVPDVEAKAVELKNLVAAAQGIVSDSKLRHEANGTVTLALVFEVPLSANDILVSQIKKSPVRSQTAVQNPHVPINHLATARIEVTLTNLTPIMPSDEGMGIRTGLYYSFKFFSWAVIFVIVGVVVVVPCILFVMLVVRLIVWLWKKPAVKTAA